MGLEVNTRKDANVVIVDLSGRITLGKDSGQLRETIRELLIKGHKKILLNLEDVDYVDSAGLAELVSGLTATASRGGVLKLLKAQKRVLEVMRLTRLSSVFETFNNEAEALQSFEN